MIVEKLVAIGFALGILAQAWVVRLWAGTWLVPGAVFGLFWFVYTAIPLLMIPDAPVHAVAVGYLFACCVVFSTGAAVFDWQAARKIFVDRAAASALGSPVLKSGFYLASSLTLIFMAIDISIQGFGWRDVVFDLLNTANQYMSRRYSETLVSNVYGRMSYALIYPAAILGGFVYAADSKKPKSRGVLLLALAPSLVTLLIHGAKGNLFLVLAFFWAATAIVKLQSGASRQGGWRAYRGMLVWAAVFFVLVAVSFISRGSYQGSDTALIVKVLVKYFASYSAAHLYAFSDWFAYRTGVESVLSYSDSLGDSGFYTFTAVARWLGVTTEVPPGVYEEYFRYKDIIQSNIFTMYRGLINDFGFAGSLIVMLVMGFLLHFIHYAMMVARGSVIATVVFVHSVGFYYTSFIVSLGIWNSFYVSMILVALALWTNQVLSKTQFMVRLKGDA